MVSPLARTPEEKAMGRDDGHRELGWSALAVRLHWFLTEHGKHLLETA